MYWQIVPWRLLCKSNEIDFFRQLFHRIRLRWSNWRNFAVTPVAGTMCIERSTNRDSINRVFVHVEVSSRPEIWRALSNCIQFRVLWPIIYSFNFLWHFVFAYRMRISQSLTAVPQFHWDLFCLHRLATSSLLSFPPRRSRIQVNPRARRMHDTRHVTINDRGYDIALRNIRSNCFHWNIVTNIVIVYK